MNIEKQIDNFEKHIVSYRKNLNDKSIFLFLASMGLYSLSKYPLMTIFSEIVILAFFIKQVFESLGDNKTFPKIYENIHQQIENLDNPEKIQLRYKLDYLYETKQNEYFKIFIIDGWPFLLSIGFYAYSVFILSVV